MPDIPDLVRMTQDPRTPPDERYDANAELWRDFVSQLTFPNLEEVREELGPFLAGPFAKAFRFEEYTRRDRPPPTHPRAHTSILHVNELGLVDNAGMYGAGPTKWVERRSSLGFQFLKDVERSVDLIAAIKLTRQRQIEAFCRPEREEGPLGFRIIRRDGAPLTEQDVRNIQVIQTMLMHSGDVTDYRWRRRLRRDLLPQFAKKVIGDSLIADACPIEVTYTEAGRVSGWHAIDFSTVRLTSEEGYEGDDEIYAVQVHDGTARVAYTYNDLIYEIRNPRTDIFSGGYGVGEAELVVRAITNYLNAVTFNSAGIDRSAVPRGLLLLQGKFNENTLASFKRQWQAMLQGASNRHRIPILETDAEGGGIVWQPIDTFNEMYFARWMTFLVSVTCAVYGIDPAEIHFDSFSIRPSSLSGSDTQEKIALSRDKGLIPLIAFFERVMDIIVQLIDPQYAFAVTGLHEDDAMRKHDRMRMSCTINEFRALDGLDPHPSELIGNAPTNPSLMQLYLMEVQQQAGVAAGMDPLQVLMLSTGMVQPAAQQAQQDQQEQAKDGAEATAGDASGDDTVAKARRPGDFIVYIDRGGDAQ